MISRVLVCEMEQFQPRVHIFRSETRHVDFMSKENVNLMVELSLLTLLAITDYLFSHHFDTQIQAGAKKSPGLWGLESLWSKVCICCIRINLRILFKKFKNGNVIVIGLMIFRSRFVQMKVPGSLWPDPMGSKV